MPLDDGKSIVILQHLIVRDLRFDERSVRSLDNGGCARSFTSQRALCSLVKHWSLRYKAAGLNEKVCYMFP